MDKERQKMLASLPFTEKLTILEKLRERNHVIAASGLRKMSVRRAGMKRGDGRGSDA